MNPSVPVFGPEAVAGGVVGRGHDGDLGVLLLHHGVDVELVVLREVHGDRPAAVHPDEVVVQRVGGDGDDAVVPPVGERLEYDVNHLVGPVAGDDAVRVDAVELPQRRAQVPGVGVRVSVQVPGVGPEVLGGGRVGAEDVRVGVEPDLSVEHGAVVRLEVPGGLPHYAPVGLHLSSPASRSGWSGCPWRRSS